MKTTISILVIAVAAFSALAGGGVPAAPQSADPIETIRQQYANINQKVPSYRRVKKNLSGFSAEGGQLVAYFHGPSVMKMVATFLGESGKASEEYYFWNGKLMFVFRTENRYDKPLSGKVVKKTENRFYFQDDKLIKWLGEDGKEVPSDSAEFAPKQEEYLKTSKQLAEGAKSKSQTIEGQ